MGKQSPRKAPKRKQPERPQLDEDLSELAAVLDEHRLENNAEGWFKLPWRDGWNAADLAFNVYLNQLGQSPGVVERILTEALDARKSSAQLYWDVTERLTGMSTDGSWRFLYAAYRCVQVLISNSSGGGEVYNDLLRRALRDMDDELTERFVLQHRMQDALGVSRTMDGGTMDRARRAFTIAWQRGLYHAAYAIQPAKQIAITSTIWVSEK